MMMFAIFGHRPVAVGDRVFVRYLDGDARVGECAGAVSFVEDRDGLVSELVVESDGAAHFVAVERLITVERED